MKLAGLLRPRISKPFVFFSTILLVKSFLAYFVAFGSGSSWKPLYTEIPFFWLIFCLIELLASKRKMVYYFTANLLLTGIYFAVIMYYKYYGVIVTYHALGQVGQVPAVQKSVFSLLDPYYLLIFTDVVVLLFILLFRRKSGFWQRANVKTNKRSLPSAIFALSLAVCLMNVWPNRASMNEVKKAEEMGILNYQAYTIIVDDSPEPAPMSRITQEAIDRLKEIRAPETPEFHGAAKGRNVIIVQLESFQNFLIDLNIGGTEITPNINKLAKESFYFPNFYQQVGQGNTSDAEFVVNTSFYIPPRGAATQEYVDRALPSLPKLMKAAGYDTATFHTNDVSFWNRDDLYAALGFDRYYDRSFFKDEDAFFFGASDEVLYRKTAEQLKRMNEAGKPFYAQVVSMSAHHPFTIPEAKQRIRLPERYADTFVGDYIRAQNYADYAFGQFIDELKENGVWDNSLVIVYGDHLGLPLYSLGRDDKQLMQEIYGREYGYTDMINIPLIIASPGVTHPAVLGQIGGQVDILPTVANLSGISLEGHVHFGQDLLNQTYNLLPQRYYLPSGSFVSGKSLFMPGDGFADGTQYTLAGDTAADGVSYKQGVTEAEYNRALQLLHMSDSYVRQLPERPTEAR